MGCRIGMATNVAERIDQHKKSGEVPENATYETLDSGLTYVEANEKEAKLRKECGEHCDGQGGGAPVAGRKWSVYRIDWR